MNFLLATTIDIPEFSIPTPLFIFLAACFLGWAVGDQILGRFVWVPLARKYEHTIVSHSLMFIPYTICGGPLLWFVVAKEMSSSYNRNEWLSSVRHLKARRAYAVENSH